MIYDIAGPPRVKGGIVLAFPKKSSLGLKREDGLSNRLETGGRGQPPRRLGGGSLPPFAATLLRKPVGAIRRTSLISGEIGFVL